MNISLNIDKKKKEAYTVSGNVVCIGTICNIPFTEVDSRET